MMDFDGAGVDKIDYYKFKLFVATMCQSSSQDTAETLYQIFDVGESNGQQTLLTENEIADLVYTAEMYLGFLNDKTQSEI